MAVLYSKLRLEVPNALDGQNATITSAGGATRTVEMSAPITDVMLAGLEKYRVQAGYTDESVAFGYGQIKKVGALYVPANLDDAPWPLIQQLISDGNFGTYYAIGDTKTFVINNKTYTAEVVAINDGTGDAAQWYQANTVDFITKELYETTYRYNATNTNAGGFPSSEVKTTLNNTIYPLLPTDLKDVITPKSHSYQAGSYSSSWSSSMVTSSDKLWLPTYYEIAGATNQYASGETSSNNKAYTLASKIKNIVGSSAGYWWLGSPYSTYGTTFWHVGTDGHFYTSAASTTIGVPVCFRIG